MLSKVALPSGTDGGIEAWAWGMVGVWTLCRRVGSNRDCVWFIECALGPGWMDIMETAQGGSLKGR